MGQDEFLEAKLLHGSEGIFWRFWFIFPVTGSPDISNTVTWGPLKKKKKVNMNLSEWAVNS